MQTGMWNGLRLTEMWDDNNGGSTLKWNGVERRSAARNVTTDRVVVIERKITGIEHYVSGRGWLKRLLAWVMLSIVMAAGFFVQQHHINDLESRISPAPTVETR